MVLKQGAQGLVNIMAKKPSWDLPVYFFQLFVNKHPPPIFCWQLYLLNMLYFSYSRDYADFCATGRSSFGSHKTLVFLLFKEA